MSADSEALVQTVREGIDPNDRVSLAALDALASELQRQTGFKETALADLLQTDARRKSAEAARDAAVKRAEEAEGLLADISDDDDAETERATENGRLAQTHWDRAEVAEAELEQVKAERDAAERSHITAVKRAVAAEARLDTALAALREIERMPSGTWREVAAQCGNIARTVLAEIEGEA